MEDNSAQSEIDQAFVEAIFEARLEREIERISVALRTETTKKLDMIQFFLMHHYGIETHVGTKENLMAFLRSPDCESEMLMEIQFLLEERFSRGYPNYVFEFGLRSSVSRRDLLTSIEESMPKNEEIAATDIKYTYISRISDIDFEEDNHLLFKVRYLKYKEVQEFGQPSSQSTESDVKMSFDIFFDFNSSLCHIQCGDQKYLRAFQKVFNSRVTGVFSRFNGYSIEQKLTDTRFAGDIDLHSQTIVIMDYLMDTINANPAYDITDYQGIYFGNTYSEKVKQVRLKGTNLLESYEVTDRIRMGDKIRGVKFLLRYLIGTDYGVLSTVDIDFRAPLKIRFSNLESTVRIPEMITHLINSIEISSQKEYTQETIREQLEDLEKAIGRDTLAVQATLNKIVKQFREIGEPQLSLNTVIGIIDSYRVGE